MRVDFTKKAQEHYYYWQRHDKKMASRIERLIADILRDPYGGIGKPEPLKHDYSGYWSRRMDDEHRLVYRVTDEAIEILQCRFHYDD